MTSLANKGLGGGGEAVQEEGGKGNLCPLTCSPPPPLLAPSGPCILVFVSKSCLCLLGEELGASAWEASPEGDPRRSPIQKQLTRASL